MQSFMYVLLAAISMLTTWALDFNFEDLANQFSSGSPCPSFKCPVNQYVAPKSHYQVVANGCGTVGFQLQQMEAMDFTDCCNWHDACYATCGLKKSTCEKKFDTCLKKMCHTLRDAELQQQCQQNKMVYVLGVQTMGCQAYEDSQAEACACVKTEAEVTLAYKNRIQHLYETYSDEELSLEKTQQSLLDKYTGKEPTMLFRLLKKFPQSVQIEAPADEEGHAFEHHKVGDIDINNYDSDVDHIEL